MKKIFLSLFLFFPVVLGGLPIMAQTQKLDVYFFYSATCPHCTAENKFWDDYLSQNPETINLHKFELNESEQNVNLLMNVGEHLNNPPMGVPYLVIGDEVIAGYGSDDTTGKQIENKVKYCQSNTCSDTVYKIVFGKDKPSTNDSALQPTSYPVEENKVEEKIEGKNVDLGILGSINTSSFSLPILTVLIAFIDGFNPCAMWVLIFLISILVGLKNRLKMWTLGLAFILTSGIMYYLFLAAWLNIFLYAGYIKTLQIIVGLVAIASGLWNLKKFSEKDTGCVASEGQKRQKVFEKIKNITLEKNFFLALVGIVLLAITINLFELICSAGLPAVYTETLSLSDLPKWQYYAYLLLYVVIFMLDDLIVFVVGMITLRTVGISKKYGKLNNLIGGIIILVLGILLILNPGWIM